jgi:hypothetical protein
MFGLGNKVPLAKPHGMRRLSRARSSLFILSFILLSPNCFADSIRPAYLEIVEQQPGVVDVVWKVPKVPGLPDILHPTLPASYQPTTPKQRIDSPDAIIFKWSMVGDPLAGSSVGIAGLETFTMEALLRIELADGTTYRHVLIPTAPVYTLPAPQGAPERNGLPIRHWLYPALLLLAFALSLSPAARQRGIVLCALALLFGSLGGHAVGHALPRSDPGLSHAQAKRILQGLMLHTYRAFILEDDEAAYDALSRSVEGKALDDIYLQNRGVLSFNDPEAAASLVDRLDVKTITSIIQKDDGTVAILADWDVYGSVFHWEHVHFRCNAFKAEITLKPNETYWKIVKLDILEEERVL